MDCPTTPLETSQPPSPASTTTSSSIDIIVTPSSLPQNTHDREIHLDLPLSSPYDLSTLQPNELYNFTAKLGGINKIHARRANRHTAEDLASWRQRKLEILYLSTFGDKLLKEPWIRREIKRSNKTKISPGSFQFIDIRQYNKELDTFFQEPGSDGTHTHWVETGVGNVFAGRILIQDAFSAMKQALAENSKYRTRSLESGRYSYFVDASISKKRRLTGLAMVYKTDQDGEEPPWTTQGFQIKAILDSTQAETWAIWQALSNVRQKVQADCAESEEPSCAVAVIYSDCAGALQRMEKNDVTHHGVTKMVVEESIELRRLGVYVCLHWVPGHRGVPGNELADRVAKKSTLPMPSTSINKRMI